VRKFRAGAYLRGTPPPMRPQCHDVLGCALVVPRHIRMFLDADLGRGLGGGGEGGGGGGELGTLAAIADAMRRARAVEWTVEAMAGGSEHDGEEDAAPGFPPPPPKVSRYTCGAWARSAEPTVHCTCSAPVAVSATPPPSLSHTHDGGLWRRSIPH
jgi:hypothetical protein